MTNHRPDHHRWLAVEASCGKSNKFRLAEVHERMLIEELSLVLVTAALKTVLMKNGVLVRDGRRRRDKE